MIFHDAMLQKKPFGRFILLISQEVLIESPKFWDTATPEDRFKWLSNAVHENKWHSLNMFKYYRFRDDKLANVFLEETRLQDFMKKVAKNEGECKDDSGSSLKSTEEEPSLTFFALLFF